MPRRVAALQRSGSSASSKRSAIRATRFAASRSRRSEPPSQPIQNRSSTRSVPATSYGGAAWPLVLDAYTLHTIAAASGPLLPGSLGLLDADGRATAQVVVPPGSDPALAGLQLHHAFGLIDPTAGPAQAVTLVSEAVGLSLVP